MFVPTPVIVTAASAPAAVSRGIGDTTVHGLLAATLALGTQDDSSRWRQWRAVWPSKHAFQQSHPLLWDPKLQNLLPPAAKGPAYRPEMAILASVEVALIIRISRYPERTRAKARSRLQGRINRFPRYGQAGLHILLAHRQHSLFLLRSSRDQEQGCHSLERSHGTLPVHGLHKPCRQRSEWLCPMLSFSLHSEPGSLVRRGLRHRGLYRYKRSIIW